MRIGNMGRESGTVCARVELTDGRMEGCVYNIREGTPHTQLKEGGAAGRENTREGLGKGESIVVKSLRGHNSLLCR